MWRLNDSQVKTGDLWNLLVGNIEVFVDPSKELLKYVGDGLGTQEVICGASSYYNFLGGFCIKDAEIMVYDMIGET